MPVTIGNNAKGQNFTNQLKDNTSALFMEKKLRTNMSFKRKMGIKQNGIQQWLPRVSNLCKTVP